VRRNADEPLRRAVDRLARALGLSEAAQTG